MSDYTPTTETIRDRIVSSNYTQGDQPDLGAAFDRWLAAHDAEIRRAAEQSVLHADYSAIRDSNVRAKIRKTAAAAARGDDPRVRHDEYCQLHDNPDLPQAVCACAFIAEVRADEREKAEQSVSVSPFDFSGDHRFIAATRKERAK